MSWTIEPDWEPDDPSLPNDQLVVYDDLRRRCPVAFSERHQWSLLRHGDVLAVARDHHNFSNVVSAHLSVPNGMDPPEHTPFRAAIDPFFDADSMGRFEPRCRAVARQLVENLANDSDIETMECLARPYAAQAQCAFLDWPASLQDWLIQWMCENRAAMFRQDREALSHLAEIFDHRLNELLDAHRHNQDIHPNQDVTNRNTNRDTHDKYTNQDTHDSESNHDTHDKRSNRDTHHNESNIPNNNPDTHSDCTYRLLSVRIDSRPLTNREIISILRNWTAGEIGTIAASVGVLLAFLGREQSVQATLRASPERLPEAIDEILRIDGPLIANRRVVRNGCRLGDREIPASARLSLFWAAANRDEAVFPQPDKFKWDRPRADNLLYGAGVHVCPGAPLARLELQVILEEILRATRAVELSTERPPTRARFPSGGFEQVFVRLYR